MNSSAPPAALDQNTRWAPQLGRMTVAVMLAAFFSLIGVQLLVGRYLYADGFQEAEQRDLLARARHAQAVLRQGFSQLTPGASDYADWDATDQFILGRRPDYPTDNWTIATLRRFQADLVFIVDSSGQILLQRGLDATRAKFAAPSAAEAAAVRPSGRLWRLRDRASAREGYIAIDGLAYQWAAAPVRRDDGKGPSDGWIMLLQRLDAAFIANLDRTLDSKAAFEIVPDAAIEAVAASVPLRPDELRIKITSGGTVTAAFVVGSLGNNASLRLKLSTPRYLIARLTTISTYFFWASLALGGMIAAIAMLWVRHRLLQPLAQVSERLRTIGEELDLSARVPLLGHGDEITGVAIAANRLLARVASIHDVEQARDAALAASRSKSEFLARMSHEIRTPMNGVLGMTELLRGTKLDGRQQKYAETIRHSAESLLTIINDILDVSKIEAGKMALDDAPFDLEQVVEEASELLAESAHTKGLELICRLPPDLHTAYRGDGMRLRQVLINLLGNAVKFTHSGQICVRVSELAAGKPGRASLRFEVQDTGIGIQPASQATIFDSFAQADGSTTRQYGGTGLGLAISKQLVELMGGQIDLQSTPGRGSTFGFTVPLARTMPSGTEHVPESLGGSRILIVDDNATNREILREHLRSWKAVVAEASGGAEALQQLASAASSGRPFDLVILDYQMPGMNGMDVVRATRLTPRLRDLPVVLLSSMSPAEEDTDWRAQRVDACLTKPVRRKYLYTALSRVLADAPSGTATLRALQVGATAPATRMGLHVLLVEDNPVNQLVACGMLEQLGCTVTVAGDGLEGVKAFERGQFNVVLMDCHMPKLDGYGATAQIRAHESKAGRRRTPVIALTANALEGDRAKCLAVGMDEHLAKPITLERLRRALQACEAVSAFRQDVTTG